MTFRTTSIQGSAWSVPILSKRRESFAFIANRVLFLMYTHKHRIRLVFRRRERRGEMFGGGNQDEIYRLV